MSRINTYGYALVEIAVHRPELSDEKRQKREAALIRAVSRYGKAALREGGKRGDIR